MKKFEMFLNENGLGYYVTENAEYKEYLINKFNGVIVRWFKGTRSPFIKNSDGSWTKYSAKQLMADLAK